MAAALWAEVAPAKTLDKALLKPPYYIAKTYADEFGISPISARTHLRELVDGDAPKFTRRQYRFKGQRQPEYVYWPAGVAAPDEAQ